MKNSRAIKEEMHTLREQMRALVDKPEGKDGDLSTEQRSKFEALKGSFEALEKQLSEVNFLEEAERRAAGVPLNAPNDFDAACKRFSLCRAIAGAMGAAVDDGLEREVSAELRARDGHTDGLRVPLEIFKRNSNISTTVPAGGPGSNLIGTDHMGQEYIDLLREASVLGRVGARMLSGLRGNVDIPAAKAGASAAWFAEDSAIPASGESFRKVSLTPKHCGMLTELSRNMILQSSPDVEQIVRADFAAGLAAALDAAAVAGDGTGNAPLGILNMTDVKTLPNAAASWDGVLALEALLDNEAAMPTGWICGPDVLKLLRGTPRVAGDGAAFLAESRNMLDGLPLWMSSHAGKSIILGNFADLMIGYWGSLEIVVNPYAESAYSKGNVLVRGILTCDVAARHENSFAVCKDFTASA